MNFERGYNRAALLIWLIWAQLLLLVLRTEPEPKWLEVILKGLWDIFPGGSYPEPTGPWAEYVIFCIFWWAVLPFILYWALPDLMRWLARGFTKNRPYTPRGIT